MGNWNTGGGGGSAGDFDDSFNEAMGYTGGDFDEGDVGSTSVFGGGGGGSAGDFDEDFSYGGLQDKQMDELDSISSIFERLDTAYGDARRGNWINSVTDYTVLNADMEVMNFDPRGSRVGAEDAAFLAGAMGLYGTQERALQEVPDYSGVGGYLTKLGVSISNEIAERLGTSLTRDYIVSPVGEGYIGKVYDDFAFSDAIGNLIGMVVPGGAKVDRALAIDVTGRGMGSRDFGFASTIFGESASLMTPAEREQQMIAQREQEEAERAAGGGDQEYGAAVLAAQGITAAQAMTSARMGSLRRSFIGIAGPSIYPSVYEGSRAVGDFFTETFGFAEGGTVKKANGGSVETQMNSVMASESFPALNAAEVQRDPEAFMLNPMKARTAEELQAMYKYNEYVLEVANTPIKAQEGMQVGEPESQPSADGPVGFVGKKTPESLPEAKTVADDVPVDVEEGTFIISGAAVEFAGSDDIKAMLLDAISEARRQGVDISGDENKIDREKAVSLLVSEGEVVVPPLLAKIIGYDRLNKINNRGKQEVEKRVQENGQSPEAESLDEQPANPAEGMAMAEGGKTASEILNEEMSYATAEGPKNRARVLKRAQEADPEGFAQIQEKNTDDLTEWMNMAQFYADDYISKSPEPIQKLDAFLLANAPFNISVQYGSEDSGLIKVGERMRDPDYARGLKTGKTGTDDALITLPGEDKRPSLLYHEYGHVAQPRDQEQSTFERIKTQIKDTISSLGRPVGEPGKPQEEVAVTSLDLYRGLHSEDVTEILGAIEYLDKQYKRQGFATEFVPDFTTDEGVAKLADNAAAYALEVVENNNLYSQQEKENLVQDIRSSFAKNADLIKKFAIEFRKGEYSPSVEAYRRIAKAPGGFVSAQGQGSTGESDTGSYKQANLSTTYEGDGFVVKPRVNYDERTNTQEYPDGVIVNEKGKNIGFAMDGQMFLSDDKSIRAGFERQTSNVDGRVNLPEQYGGETITFGNNTEMKRYSMGATFGPLDVDLSKTRTPGGDSVMGGSARYRFSENGDVTLEAMDDGRSGRIALNYRF